MPAQPAYFHRLGDALAAIRAIEQGWIDRKAIEEALGVSKTVAWRIMRRCGAVEGPGNTLICRREELIAALTQWQATGEVERESRRRDRLSSYLERMAEVGRSRRTPVASAQQAMDMVNARFDRLPAGIRLTRKQLVVEFGSAEEFLQRMGAVIFALQNDYESIREFIEQH